ncbi:MAG: substrate-binding domain-containing protein [Gemmatimonadota bacterium]
MAVSLLALALGTAIPVAAQTPRGIILATTTSMQDTGLLDSLVPRFEHRCRCRVKTIAVGTGQALALGARGEADVVLVHAPTLELEYVREGTFVDRRLVMTNDFVLVGPKADPAGIRQARTVVNALRRIASGPHPFASRADSSGTNILELGLWKRAGVAPRGPWYFEVGQGMGATLRLASQKQAYALTDRGTFLSQRHGLDLAILHEGDAALLNVYHVMRPNPDVFSNLNVEGGRAFADFMVEPATQAFIAQFGVARFGQPLFRPAAGRREEDLLRKAS